MASQTILQVLKHAAEYHSNKGLIMHHPNITDGSYTKISYAQLYDQVSVRAERLASIDALSSNQIIVLHVEHQLDGISWFWAILATGGIPCMSTPSNQDFKNRQRHIMSLQKLLDHPLFITTDELLSEFSDLKGLRVLTTTDVDNISTSDANSSDSSSHTSSSVLAAGNVPGLSKKPEDLAALMLTSGSTGDSKALLSSIDGKIKRHETTSRDTFLAWTGIDHVANLVEIHLHAMRLGANQIHIPPSSAVQEPLNLLQKLSDHQVSYTFGPNFLLAEIARALESLSNQAMLSLDLSYLRAFISGGEANSVATAVKLTGLLQKYHAPASFIRPGLGLTETCAGAVYSNNCPSYDISQNTEHCSVGFPTDAIQVRVVRSDTTAAAPNEIGSLQLSGPCVFKSYYNNPEVTLTSFTSDGWFRTGDLALIDTDGKLLLTGREKDTIIINGIKYYSQAIESAVEAARIPGVTPSHTATFPYWPEGHHTEVLCIVYLPTYDAKDYAIAMATEAAISKSVIVYCGVRPYRIIPLVASFLQKSSLGKLSRQKIRAAFEGGKYAAYGFSDEAKLTGLQHNSHQPAATVTEQTIIDVYLQIFPTGSLQIGRNSDLSALGGSSIDLLRLKSSLQTALSIHDIPINTLFAHTVLHELAEALDLLNHTRTFSPVVVLQPHGDKTPIWFVHSGLGEVLIFMNLARHITGRPVYALRARGFDGEPHFTSLDEMVATYHSAIKSTQPEGPYALAGYASGCIATFEIAKRMKTHGDAVSFLGVLDEQPVVKHKARKFDWYKVVLHIAFFLSLMSEEDALSYLPEAQTLSHEQVLNHIMALAPDSRLHELGMTKAKIDNWANIAFGLKKFVCDYDARGEVRCMDVFYTAPVGVGSAPAVTLDEWFSGSISKWDGFVSKGGAKYHVVEGTHRTMITPPNLLSFHKSFSKAMEERGV
ncbi:Didemethylasterriquinone D synthetase [Lachnellula occidentalis]|uniref:Didemethylasterriquinone D synthetase n=1 Tax=Lachnellula occidentalis TaxID=215460 RepID=A0A8H8RK26_9HELO|nr:Didemethylasterriquinone D synthetase [Lachnellula occidentalis]